MLSRERRFTRLVPGMAGLIYEERLTGLGLFSLEFRRMRRDLRETYKIPTGQRQDRCREDVPDGGEVQNQGSQSEDLG